MLSDKDAAKDRLYCIYFYETKIEVDIFSDLQKELDESVEKCRSLQMENHQFKEQFK